MAKTKWTDEPLPVRASTCPHCSALLVLEHQGDGVYGRDSGAKTEHVTVFGPDGSKTCQERPLKAKAGRPVSTGAGKSKLVAFRPTAAERARLEEEAAAVGVSVGDLARRRTLTNDDFNRLLVQAGHGTMQRFSTSGVERPGNYPAKNGFTYYVKLMESGALVPGIPGFSAEYWAAQKRAEDRLGKWSDDNDGEIKQAILADLQIVAAP